MLLLTKSDVERAINMREAIDAVEKAFTSFSAGRAVVPLRTQVEVAGKEAVSLYMPGFIPDLGALGIKIVSVFPQNPLRGLPTICSLVVLNNPETGEPAAALEGSWLTALRTGAASGVATRHLARRDAAVAAIIGTGYQAVTQLEGIMCERAIEEVRVFDIDPIRSKEYREEAGARLPAPLPLFKTAITPGEAVEGADIICTATTSKTPVFPGNKIRAGAHINAVGAFTPEMQEIGQDVLAQTDKVVVDSLDAALEEAGDLIIPIKKGLFRREDIYAELGEISSGRKKGREDDKEVTLFKSVGLSVQDMAVAIHVLKKAKELGLGREFTFTG